LHHQGNNLNQLTRLAHLGEIKVIDLSKVLATYEKLLETIAKESEKT
ncbi:MAG: plasmid mobilization relaxosome protein MobC, partial [Ruminococcus sp.]|nr:plasmid mobilization relaxosome protein MobC [Ruminococcus sp.]